MFEEVLKKAKNSEIEIPFIEDISFEADCESPKAKEKEIKQNFGQALF